MHRFLQYSAWVVALGWLGLADGTTAKADWVYVVQNGQVYAVQRPSQPVSANAQASTFFSTSRYGYYNSPYYGWSYPGARGITPFGPYMDVGISFGESYGPGYPATSFGFDVYGPTWDGLP